MIVTTDHCQLLCVEADNIRHIYDRHKNSMKHLIGSPGSRPTSTGSRPTSTGSDMADGTRDSLEIEHFPQEEDSGISVPVVGVV